MHAVIRLLLASALAGGLPGCRGRGDAPGADALDARPRLRVLWYGRSGRPGAAAFDRALLTVRLDDGSGQRLVRGDDLRPRELGMPTSGWLPVRDRDWLRVRVAVVALGGDTLAAGAFARALRPDRAWDLGVHAGGVNPCDPRSMAMGAGDCVALPLRRGGAVADSVFITWAGGSIREPSVTGAPPHRPPPNVALQATPYAGRAATLPFGSSHASSRSPAARRA